MEISTSPREFQCKPHIITTLVRDVSLFLMSFQEERILPSTTWKLVVLTFSIGPFLVSFITVVVLTTSLVCAELKPSSERATATRSAPTAVRVKLPILRSREQTDHVKQMLNVIHPNVVLAFRDYLRSRCPSDRR
jgi:hypothetical protein